MSWNFVSRAEQVEFVRRAIHSRKTGTIVILGEPGMGRSTFLARALAYTDPERDEIMLLSSSGAGPFTTPRGGLPESLLESVPTRDVADPAASGGTGRRFIIAVDDIQRMDYASLLVLRRLAHRGLALLLVTRPQASGGPADQDPGSCLMHDCDTQTITLLPLSVPEVAAALEEAGRRPVSRSAAAAARAATGGNPRVLGALVATTTVAEVPSAAYPGLAQLVTATWDAWRRLALDRTDELCRLALQCGAQEEIAPIWAMLLR